jgi:hypothetical protein
MKIFEKEENAWDSKVNFVDNNNVLLEYDLSKDYCEADWFIDNVAHLDGNIPNDIRDYKSRYALSKYSFDTSYYRRVAEWHLVASHNNRNNKKTMVIFRIVHDSNPKKEKFIHIFNMHNGNYGHVFEFTVGEGDPMISGLL